MWYELKELRRFSDPRGDLHVGELGKDLPFEVKRFYILTSLNKLPRGFHAHHFLQQMAYVLQGSCEFHLDNGEQHDVIRLSACEKGLHIKPMVWHEMHDFSDDCILLMLASEIYDEKDYIRDYHDFQRLVDAR